MKISKKYTKKLSDSEELDVAARKRNAVQSIEANRRASKEEILEKARAIDSMPELQVIRDGEKLARKFFVFRERAVVIAKLNGKTFPMYCSTGLAGKASSIGKRGSWFVFWGIGDDGWFNKIGCGTNEWTLNNQFGSEKIQKLAEKLDSEVGDVSGLFESETARELLDAEIDLAEAQKIVNKCFRCRTLTHEESGFFRCMPLYFQNMHLVFKQIDDKKADELLMSIAKRCNVRLDETSKKDQKTKKKDEIMKTKKRYTKKQIAEAIAYWKKQLKKIDESTSQEIPKELFKECIAADWPSIDSVDIDAMIFSTREDYNQFIDAATVPRKIRAKIDSMWSAGYDYIIYYYTDEDNGALEEAMGKMMRENPKYGLLEYARDYDEQYGGLETVYVVGLKWRRA